MDKLHDTKLDFDTRSRWFVRSRQVLQGMLFVSAISVGVSAGEDDNWQAGIPGGIPSVDHVILVTDFGAVGDGVHDDAQAFQNAVDAVLSGGGVVFAPAGDYLLRSKIRMRSGVVIRGEGAANTHLRFHLGGRSESSVEFVTYQRGVWVDVVSGLSRGSTEIRVADSSRFSTPMFAEVEQTNDPDIMYTNPYWNQPGAEGAVGEVVRIVGKIGDRLILKEPLHFTYDAAMNPRIRSQGFIEKSGLEDLHLERLDSGEGGMVLVKNAAWIWLRGVESEMAMRFHVDLDTVYQCEIRDSYFHHAHDYGTGGHGYGVCLSRHTTSCLVENNVFVHLRHAMLTMLGANGNVFGYNYSREPIWTISGTPPDISVHGWYPFYNLFEGNVAQEIAVSDYWGPAGPGNTYLRNCTQHEGLWVNDHSHSQRILGNTLIDGPRNYIDIHYTDQDTVQHGNWEAGGVHWNPEIPDHTIPESNYRNQKPTFFGDSDWPSIGGDLGPVCTNPAYERWMAGNETPQPYEPPFDNIFEDGLETGNLDSWSAVGG